MRVNIRLCARAHVCVHVCAHTHIIHVQGNDLVLICLCDCVLARLYSLCEGVCS